MNIEDKVKQLMNDDSNNTEEIEDMFKLTDEDYEKITEEYGIDLRKLENEFNNYVPKKDLNYVKLNEDAVDPKYAYETDSGFDLHSIEEFIIPPLGRHLAPTGLKFDIPEGMEMQIRPKSGLAIKQGLTVLNTPGTVDQGYNGEIKVILFNASNEAIVVSKGMKIAQGVLCPVAAGKWINLVNVKEIGDKDRGESGFGSTGIFKI